MGFCSEQLDRIESLWERMSNHQFLVQTRDGSISDQAFATWLCQDYLFVEAAIPFLGAMVPRAPAHHVGPLIETMTALRKELELFRERAEAGGVSLEDIEPSFVNHAYIQFLLASAHRETYAGAYTVLYAAEKAYFDSWMVVRQGMSSDSVWYPFVEQWSGDAFKSYVEYLETELDNLAEQAGPNERARMAELFEVTTKYEVAFWEMALTGSTWPGLEGE